MDSLTYLKLIVDPDLYIDLVLNAKILTHDFSLSPLQHNEIFDLVGSYYSKHPDSRKSPKVMFAVATHYVGCKIHFLSAVQLCQKFEINSSWFRKIYKPYLKEMINDVDLIFIRDSQFLQAPKVPKPSILVANNESNSYKTLFREMIAEIRTPKI